MPDVVVDRGSDDMLEQIGRSWGWILFFGVASIVVGGLVVARPRDTIYAFAIIVGIWLFISGLVRIVMAIADTSPSGGTRVLIAFLGLLSVLVGVIFLRHTFETIGTVGFLIGLFWIIGGLVEFLLGLRRQREPRPGLAPRHRRPRLCRRDRHPGLSAHHGGHPGHHHGHLAHPLRPLAGAPVVPGEEAGRLSPRRSPVRVPCRPGTDHGGWP